MQQYGNELKFKLTSTKTKMTKLAIIIPAFKAIYLEQALNSLANQQDKRFRVYVGDDASPEDLKSICGNFTDRLDLHYHRFEHNMGGTALAKHWNRCIALTSESWLWLFSDDDIADAGCNAAFQHALESTNSAFDVYHFQVNIIDGDGKLLRRPPDFPPFLNSIDFTNLRLEYKINSYAVEYIFSRDVFTREGGFISFPVAWCSDDASWAAFSAVTGIHTIAGPRVNWRQSGRNLSSRNSPYSAKKIEACLQYLEWLKRKLEINSAIDTTLSQRMSTWLYAQLYWLNPRLGWLTSWHCARRLSQICNRGLAKDLYRFSRNELRSLVKSKI